MMSKLSNGIGGADRPPMELSNSIAENARTVSEYLGTQGLPQPSGLSNGASAVLPTTSPQEVQVARQKLITASLELSRLATGPTEFLPNLALGFQYISCLSWLCQYGIFQHIAIDQPISYTALAQKAGIPEQRLKSVIRMAMTGGLFREEDDGKSISHTATSALLSRNEDVYAYATYMCSRSAPVALRVADAHRR